MVRLIASFSSSRNGANESLSSMSHMMFMGVRNVLLFWTAWNSRHLKTEAIGKQFLIARDNLHRKVRSIRRTSSIFTGKLCYAFSFHWRSVVMAIKIITA
jgi:hypothetical protein